MCFVDATNNFISVPNLATLVATSVSNCEYLEKGASYLICQTFSYAC